MALEGVRGLAAIIVVLHHFVLAFYPFLALSPTGVQHMRFEDNIQGTPLALLYAGTFAVAIFFALSGFVLTIGFFQSKSESVVKKLAAKRYLRLMLPALVITMICFVLIKLGFPRYVVEVAGITGSEWLATTSWSLNASFLDAVYSGTLGIFIQQGSPYDNVLWTMMTEFIGSFIVFAFVLLFGSSKRRWISYAGAVILTFNTWFLPFILGMALADLHASGRLDRFRQKPRLAVSAFVAAMLFGVSTSSSWYQFISHQLFTNVTIDYRILYLTIGATLLLFAVLVSRSLSLWLEKPKVSILGKYTFSLYLVHLPVLYTTGVLTFLALHSHLGYNAAVLAALLVNAPVVVLAAVFFERYVDAPAVRFSGAVAKALESGEGIGIRKYVLRIRRKVYKARAVLLRRPMEAIEEAPAD